MHGFHISFTLLTPRTGKDSIRYVADHSEISIAVCNTESLSKVRCSILITAFQLMPFQLFEVVEGKKGYKGLKHIIVMGDCKENKDRAKQVDVELHEFTDIEKYG